MQEKELSQSNRKNKLKFIEWVREEEEGRVKSIYRIKIMCEKEREIQFNIIRHWNVCLCEGKQKID